MLPFTSLIINGQLVGASDNQTFDVRNPVTGKVVGTSASASSEDCKAAVEAAANAFKIWEHTTPTVRRDIFLKAADIASTDQFKKKVVDAMSDENASALAWCLYNAGGASGYLRTQAGLVNQLGGESFPSSTLPGAKVSTQRRAMGVIFAIAPWNAPITLSLRAITIPLVCGNTVVLKSSEYTPRTQALVVELFAEAGLPAGVLNFISMSKEAAPARTAEMIAHPLVRKLNFTGSDRVGRILAMEAAKYLKPCVFELGGKAPSIILDDADIEQAARATVFGSLLHSGQICMSTERVIVQRGISKALIDAIHAITKNIKAGDTADPSIQLSPLFTESSAENFLSMIREAQLAGAEVIQGDLTREGTVVQPHIVCGIKPGMRLFDIESFGPVISIIIADTVDEAINIANTSEYSLTSSVWSSNLFVAQDVASRLRSGFTHINGITVHAEARVGLIGLGGASGYGAFSINDFTDMRVTVTHPTGRREYSMF